MICHPQGVEADCFGVPAMASSSGQRGIAPATIPSLVGNSKPTVSGRPAGTAIARSSHVRRRNISTWFRSRYTGITRHRSHLHVRADGEVLSEVLEEAACITLRHHPRRSQESIIMLGPPKPRRLDEPIAVSLEDLVPRTTSTAIWKQRST